MAGARESYAERLEEQAREQKAATSAPEISRDLYERLRVRFAWPEYVLLEEVGFGGDGSFLARGSRADGIAIGQWHSTGYGLQGFEVKATRADWLREVRTIGKADAAIRFCSRFWLVAPEGVAKPEELPGNWGWLAPHGSNGRRTLRVRRQAPRLEAAPLPPGTIAHFLGVAVRRGSGDTTRLLREEYERGLEAGREQEARKYRPDELGRLRAAVDRFEEASGVKIDQYESGDVGKAVRFVRNGGLSRQEKKIVELGATALEILQAIALVQAELPERPYGTKKVDVRAMLQAGGIEPRADGW